MSSSSFTYYSHSKNLKIIQVTCRMMSFKRLFLTASELYVGRIQVNLLENESVV